MQKPLRRHTNADIASKTSLLYEEHASQSGICSVCMKCGKCEISKKAREGAPLFPEPFGVAQFGAEKRVPNIEDIQILPELYGSEIIFHDVKTEIELGGFLNSVPLVVAAMGSTKVAADLAAAVSAGSAKAGIAMVIGENVLATFGKDGLKSRIENYLEGYKKFGAVIVQGNALEQKQNIFEAAKELGAHGIELKFGQGAKQGLGGEIKFESQALAEKYRKMGYKIIKNADGSYQRHVPPGSLKDDELRSMVIKYAELDLPIWVKTGIGRGILKLINSLNEIKKEQDAPIECLTIDGHGGGTGMSPWLIMNETSLPSASVFGILQKKPGFDILLAGGYTSGCDAAKAMMFGARGVALGRAMLIAATVDKQNGIVNFVNALKQELQMICATQRVNSVEKLIGKKENLYPLSEAAEKMFGLKREFV